ncbi:MAG: acyl-CoA thioesterase, partial [Rubrobacteraceae bacterium]
DSQQRGPLSYFEVGRVEWLRAARFDDELVIRVNLTDLRRVSLRFEYEVLRGEELIATGHTRHGCVKLEDGKPAPIPEGLFKANLKKSPPL